MERNIMKRGWQQDYGEKKMVKAKNKNACESGNSNGIVRQWQHNNQQKRKINSILFEYTQINIQE